jgi:hypothetical protein
MQRGVATTRGFEPSVARVVVMVVVAVGEEGRQPCSNGVVGSEEGLRRRSFGSDLEATMVGAVRLVRMIQSTKPKEKMKKR